MTTKEELDKRYVQDLIYKKNLEVIEVMKRIPKGQLFCWKFEEKK